MIRHHLAICLFGILSSYLARTGARQTIVAVDNPEHRPDRPFPYLVSVLFHKLHRGKIQSLHVCAGGIIRDDLVITAAHCHVTINNRFNSRPISVKAEDVEIYVSKVFVTRSFKPPTRNAADIAILQLNNTLGLANHTILKPIELPKKGRVSYEGKCAEITGLGWQKHERGDIINISHCQQRYRNPNIEDNQLCVRIGHHSENHHNCFGDVGSLLVLDGTLIGISSRTPENCSNESVAVFTKVVDNLTFINHILTGQRNGKYVREEVL